MFHDVDCIGVDSVVQQIKLTQLSRFIIYRQGAGRGSTPVFECITTNQNSKAIQAFKDWSNAILKTNPNTVREYEILLFDKETDADSLGEEDDDEKNPKKNVRKSNKVRITFALNALAGGYGSSAPVDIAGEIEKGIQAAMDRRELEEWRTGKRRRDGDEDDEDDEDESVSALEKVYMIVKEINKGGSKGAAIAGEDEDSDDLDFDEEKPKVEKKKPIFSKEEVDAINKALKVLKKKDPKICNHLVKLANLSVKQPIIFNAVLEKLDNLKV